MHSLFPTLASTSHSIWDDLCIVCHIAFFWYYRSPDDSLVATAAFCMAWESTFSKITQCVERERMSRYAEGGCKFVESPQYHIGNHCNVTIVLPNPSRGSCHLSHVEPVNTVVRQALILQTLLVTPFCIATHSSSRSSRLPFFTISFSRNRA